MSTLKANKYQHVDRSSPSIEINADGSVSIASTVTYEDVTSVDSVGVITGRSNADLQSRVNVGSGVSINAGGLNVTAGISTLQAVTATTGTFSGYVDIAQKIVHTGDADTSIEFDTNIIKFETAGSERARITGTDVLLGTGSNTTATTQNSSVSRNLQLIGSNNLIFSGMCGNMQKSVIIEALHDGRTNHERYAQINLETDNTDNGDIVFHTASYTNAISERLRIDSGGLVTQKSTWSNTYIGTATTQCGYQVQNQSDTTNTYAALRLTAGSSSPATAQIASIRTGTGQNDLAFQLETSNAAFEAMRLVGSNGGLYIGIPGNYTANSSANSLILGGTSSGTNTGMTIVSNASQSGNLAFGDADDAFRGAIQYLHASDAMRILTAGAQVGRIDSSQRVMLGADDSTSVGGGGNTVQIVGSTAYTGTSIIRTAAAGGNISFAAGSSGTNVSSGNALGYIKAFGYHTNGYDEYARITFSAATTTGDGDAPGKITLSTTNDGASSPTDRLTIDAQGKAYFTPNEAGGFEAKWTDVDSAGPFGKFWNSDSVYGGGVQFKNNNARGGVEFLNTSGSNVASLYNSTGGWHWGANIILDSGGIGFNDTSTANHLDDYEEGSWTPYLNTNGAGTLSATYTVQTGRFTKIGDLVYVMWDITVSDTPSGNNGYPQITGLPFTPRSSQTDGGYPIPLFRDSSAMPADARIYATSSYGHNDGDAIWIQYYNSSGAIQQSNGGTFWASGRCQGTMVYKV